MFIQRHASSIVQSALNRQAAVALIGPRQVGKTTLAWPAERLGTGSHPGDQHPDRDAL